jgi:thiamine biosynthesis lipoprotein
VSESYLESIAVMGTVVTIQVVGHGVGHIEQRERQAGVARAMDWFRETSDRCSRFDPASELSRLSTQVGIPVQVSPLLFELLRFSLAVAEESEGAFDPTVGRHLEERGFNREFRSGAVMRTGSASRAASFRDVLLDDSLWTVTLRSPLTLDLGAVAKGLAIDLAARELLPFRDFAIDAGGDLYLGGLNADGAPWAVGIRHPREPGQVLETLRVSDAAVCTSGDYERTAPDEPGGHHIVDARAGVTATGVTSVTVRAASAMVADALATAAFVLGPVEGMALLQRHAVEGMMLTPSLERFATPGFAS